VIETFFKRFVLILDCNVADFVDLVETLYAVLDKFREFDGAFDGVGDTLNDDLVVTVLRGGEKLMSSLEVAANTDSALDSDFIRRQLFLYLLYTSVLISHGL